jgi:predicted TIM-barrel fold metal-dependent hydrolase
VTFTENPVLLGYPSFHDEHWDPMWRALVDEGSILNIHLGSSGQLAVTAPDAPMDVMITLQPMNICMAAADLVWSRVFKTYPELKVALSEGGTGWIPYFLDRLDRTYDVHHAWTGADFGEGVMPSDVFREHILTCFITDPIGLALRDVIGVDNICWEQDYPHSDSSWPEAPEELVTMASRYNVSDADLDKMTHENAMRWYRFDPFTHIAREQCTVGALRASVAGHDVSIHAMDQGRYAGAATMNLAELAAAATA